MMLADTVPWRFSSSDSGFIASSDGIEVKIQMLAGKPMVMVMYPSNSDNPTAFEKGKNLADRVNEVLEHASMIAARVMGGHAGGHHFSNWELKV